MPKTSMGVRTVGGPTPIAAVRPYRQTTPSTLAPARSTGRTAADTSATAKAAAMANAARPGSSAYGVPTTGGPKRALKGSAMAKVGGTPKTRSADQTALQAAARRRLSGTY